LLENSIPGLVHKSSSTYKKADPQSASGNYMAVPYEGTSLGDIPLGITYMKRYHTKGVEKGSYSIFKVGDKVKKRNYSQTDKPLYGNIISIDNESMVIAWEDKTKKTYNLNDTASVLRQIELLD
jgi:hypothetical protein